MGNETSQKQVRTYMSYSIPIDPVKMVTIPDMDLSYALAATLVEWDKHKQISSGIAAKWEVVGEHTFRFFIRKNLKWSDGSPINSQQIKASFKRALEKYPEDLRSLGNILSEMKCPTDDSLDFILKTSAKDSNLLGKLTEPNFGVLNLGPPGSKSSDLNLTVSTGPFFISTQSENEITLKRNPNWVKANTDMPEEVIIRRPVGEFSSETVLLKDTWANMIETSSMINSDVVAQYEKDHFQIWKRPLDKMGVFHLSPSRANPSGFGLFRYLRKSLNKATVFKGISGVELTDQAFPRGYQLHDSKFQCDVGDAKIPEIYKTRPVHVLLSPARISSVLRKNIETELERVTGIKPIVTSVPLQDIGKYRKAGDYDFYAGTIGMADPDPEGIMSYYFEGDLPLVPKSSENFISKLDHARSEQNHDRRIEMLKSILTEATCKGHMLPLYHLSTVGVGRPELDFSEVPLTDESITLSKIRFKTGAK